MYEVVVEAPQSPGDFFSEEFTDARLQQQVNQGRIGPDNLPVYASNIVYGRMMMFSLTSTASESDIRATMQAGYNSIGGSVEANMSAKQQSILSESKIKITSIGGDAEATLAMIRSGDWSQYFTTNAPLSSASPMSYTFRNLGDGTFGTENFEPTTGTFQDHPEAGWTGDEGFAVADFDGNGRDDLIWYTQGENIHHVYFAESVNDEPRSIFNFRDRFDRGSGGWTNYKVAIGNIDGNTGADLVWLNPMGVDSSPIHRDLTTGGTPALVAGSLQWLPREGGPYLWQIKLLDVNGEGRKDFLANSLETVNHMVIGLGKDDGDFDFSRVSQDHPAGDQWEQFQFLTGDINSDSREDVLYVNADATNTVYVGLARGSAQ